VKLEVAMVFIILIGLVVTGVMVPTAIHRLKKEN
jgi:hypothetical protein